VPIPDVKDMSQPSEDILTIGPEPVAYRFDQTLPPICRVRPGRRIRIRTPDGLGGQIRSEHDHYVAVDPDRVNPIVGPLYVEGASPGDVLAVELHTVAVDAPQGYVLVIPGFGLLHDAGWGPRTKIVPFRDGYAEWAPDRRIALRPCIGTIGVAPAGQGVSTIMPGEHGGNLDTRDITSGATLYLPVRAPGALFGLGDPKAAMGDGEVCGTGIGVPSQVELTFGVIPAWPLRSPLLGTSEEWMAIASGPTLDDAVKSAVIDMVSLMVDAAGLDPVDGYMLLSVAGHLRISQVVDPLTTARVSIEKAYVSSLIPGRAHVHP
jgi:amidase